LSLLGLPAFKKALTAVRRKSRKPPVSKS
jgi:hypothetical protein